MTDENPSPKSAEEIREMRDRLASLATSESIESGSRTWHKIESAEAALDWTLGEMERYPRLISAIESKHDIKTEQ